MDITAINDKNFRVKAKKGMVVVEDGVKVVMTGNSSKAPFEINQPGEYEVEGMSVFGYPSESANVYVLQIEEVRILTLGSTLSESIVQELDVIDVILLNTDTLNSKDAVELIGKIEPSTVVPYGEQVNVAAFIKNFEHGSRESDKLSIAKATLNSELTEVVVLGV